MNKVENTIKELIKKACGELGLPQIEAELTRPSDEKFGDFSSNVALKIKSQISNIKNADENAKFNNPRQIAEAIVENLKSQISNLKHIEKIEVAGPGFINFYLSDEYFVNELHSSMVSELQSSSAEKKRVIVEYSSPNIAKPFTIGHLRSTIIGDAIANILEANGHEVLRDNHLGDWGTQFGKQIAALKWIDLETGEVAQNLNDTKILEKNITFIQSSENPVKVLVDLYVRFHKVAEENPAFDGIARAEFRELERSEKIDDENDIRNNRVLWKMCVDWSWKEFSRIYELLGVEFSQEFDSGRGLGEAFFEDKMGSVIEELNSKNLLQEGKEGAKLVFFPEDMNMPPLMILKGDGATLYATRDLATDKFRKDNFNPDLIVNEVGAEQSLYFRQVFEVEKMLGWYQEGQRVHVGHGHFRFLEGKMSTRKGNVIWLQDVLEEAIRRARKLTLKTDVEWGEDKALENMKKLDEGVVARGRKPDVDGSDIIDISNKVAIGALKWNDLKGSPDREIVFDWDEILNMKGNSGPYVQYTFARTQSVLGKAPNYKSQITNNDQNYKLNEEEKAVVRHLSRYGEAVVRAGNELSPQIIASYVYELAQRFNSFYNKHSILGGAQNEAPNPKSQITKDDELKTKEFRLKLTEAVGKTLEDGLKLLGIEAPAKM